MSESHTRGEEVNRHPITGEPTGISDILERRSNDEADPDDGGRREAEPREREEDDAEVAAREIASLRTRAADAEARAAAAAERSARAERDRATALQGAEDTGFTAITTALDSAQREKESLTAEMKTAGEAGDFGRIAEISARLGELGADIRDLNRGKQEYEANRQRRLDRPEPPRPAEPVAATATERGILSQLGSTSREAFLQTRTDATASWLRQHNEFFTNPDFFSRVTGADAGAVANGFARDTPAYFRYIEEKVLPQTQDRRDTRRDSNGNGRDRDQRDDDRRGPPGAAPSRDAPGPSGRPRERGGDTYVSADDKRAAAWLGVDAEEYVKERDRLTRNGELPFRRR